MSEAIPAAFVRAYPGISKRSEGLETPWAMRVKFCENDPDCVILELDDLEAQLFSIANPSAEMLWLDPRKLLGDLQGDEIAGTGGRKRYMLSMKDVRLLVTVLLGILSERGDKAAKEIEFPAEDKSERLVT